MKKNILFLLLIFTSFFCITFNVKAEGMSDINDSESTPEVENDDEDNTSTEGDSGKSRWATEQPARLTTSEGIIIEYDLEDFDFDYNLWVLTGIKVNVTIPEDYNLDEVVIAPEVFEKVGKIFGQIYHYDSENLFFSNYIQAADGVKFDITITNLSKYKYNYNEGSFTIIPKEDIIYRRLTEQEANGSEDIELYNGKTLNVNHHVKRLYNTALKELIPNLRRTNPNNYNSLLTDELIGNALVEKGYENGMDDYGKYLLDFYNNKYSASFTTLDQFPDGIIREILSDRDPLLNPNSAYRSLNITPWTSGSYPDTVEDILARVNSKQSNKIYNSLEEFIVEFYNNKYGENATKIIELSDEALDDFFASNGTELDSPTIETNNEVNILAYNYFYNKGLAFGFEDDNIPSTGDDSEDYSIGEYSRNNNKGDAGIEKNAAVLTPNETTEILNSYITSSGRYICDAYIGYEFMVDLQFSYSVQKSNIVINYLDINTLETLEDEETRQGKVGDYYTTEQKEFDNYSFVTVDGKPTGEYIEDTLYITYYYQKVTTITITKIWNDSEDQDKTRPEEIIIHLLANNEEIKEVRLNKENNWTESITKLPVYENNEEIVYSIIEETIEGYEVEITGDVESGFVITNTLIPSGTGDADDFNPQTGDNITTYIATLLFSLCGLSITLYLRKE